jgi:hypothetical protein
MKFIKSYKKLYQIEKEKNCELKKENAMDGLTSVIDYNKVVCIVAV